MKKVIGMLVALAVFCAMPAVAFAGAGYEGDIVSGPAQGGGDGGDGGGGGYDGGGDGGDGGDGCAISQAAGGDAHAENNCFNTNVSDADGDGVGEGDAGVGGDDDDVTGVGGEDVGGGVGGGGGVTSVGLARTGFDAWLLAVIGGLSLAGGLGLLAAQRRGRIGA